MASRAAYARALARLTLRVLALPAMETRLAVNGTAEITHRLQCLAKDLGTWNRKQTVGACFLVLAMALVSVGCDVTSNKNDRQIQALEAKVAELEHRLDQMQGAPQQPTPEQQQGRERMQSNRGKFEQRYALDVRTHTEVKVVEAEHDYEAAIRNFGSPESIEAHKKFIKKYPGFNRTGCALSELAGCVAGAECEPYYKECIQKYDDCYWGDGVQVGPFARFGLAQYYKNTGQADKAEALYTEIKENYPDALDHSGQLLADLINKH
jgi:tetratricopeptide (TPR) repeat protein